MTPTRRTPGKSAPTPGHRGDGRRIKGSPHSRSFAGHATLPPFAQGPFVYDQQSSTDETPYPMITWGFIQQLPPVGQSFTPIFSAVDFIRLKLYDNTAGNGVGATLFVNLRSGSITGSILSSTTPVGLPDGFGGTVNFLFSSGVALAAGTQYFLEPIVQSGDLWQIEGGGEMGYQGGTAFAHGNPVATDFWFREGIVVPEPSTLSLFAIGTLFLGWRLRSSSAF
jgi:hypothetical protein